MVKKLVRLENEGMSTLAFWRNGIYVKKISKKTLRG